MLSRPHQDATKAKFEKQSKQSEHDIKQKVRESLGKMEVRWFPHMLILVIAYLDVSTFL